MKYRGKPKRFYTPSARKWVERAFGKGRPRTKRFVVQYEAIVKGEPVTDLTYVLAASEKEALLKARNIVKSLYPDAKGIAVAIREEQTIPFKPTRRIS